MFLSDQLSSSLHDAPDWKLGQIVDGRYEIGRVLGEGGAGIVFEVKHLDWRIDVAVKTLKRSLMSLSTSSAELFVNEAKTWTNLGLHPNVVQCWYVRELDGIPRIFMDLLPKGSLRQWLKESTILRDDLSKILTVAIDICEGLDYAHEHGVIHCDVKPENLMMTEGGRVRVSDFGVSRVIHPETAEGAPAEVLLQQGVTLTCHGGLVGTPAYVAPELWDRSMRPSKLSDIYALGIVLFELVCGKHPFPTKNLAELRRLHLTEPVPKPRSINSEVPASLEELILRCVEKTPDLRPQSCRGIRDELGSLLRTRDSNYLGIGTSTSIDVRADVLNNQGVSFWDLSEPSRAAERWLEATRIDVNHPEATYNLALKCWRRGEIDDLDAVKRVEHVVQGVREERQAGAMLLLAWLQMERGDLTEAEKWLEDAANTNEALRHDSLWQQASNEVNQNKIGKVHFHHRFVTTIDDSKEPKKEWKSPKQLVLQKILHLKAAMRGGINYLDGRRDYVIAGSTDAGCQFVYSTETFEFIDSISYPEWAMSYEATKLEQHSELPYDDEVYQKTIDVVRQRPDDGLIWTSQHIERPLPNRPDYFVKSGDTRIDVCGTEFQIDRWTNDVLVLSGGEFLVSAHNDDWINERGPMTRDHPRSRGFPSLDFSDMVAMVQSMEEDSKKGSDEHYTVQIWGLKERVRLRGIEAPGDVKQLIGLRNKPGHFVAVSWKQAAVFSVGGGAPIAVLVEHDKETEGVLAATVDEKGQRLAVATKKSLLVFSTINWDLEKKVSYDLEGSLGGYVSKMELVSEHDVLLLLRESSLEVVQLTSGRCWRTISDLNISSFTVTSDRCRVVTGHGNGDLCVWYGLASKEFQAPLAVSRGADVQVFERREQEFQEWFGTARRASEAGNIEDAGKAIARAMSIRGYETDERALSIASGLISNLPSERPRPDYVFLEATGLEDVTPDGRLGVSVLDSDVGLIGVWALSTGRLVNSWRIGTVKRPWSWGGAFLRMTPDGRYMVTADPVMFVDLATGRICGRPEGDGWSVNGELCITRDGRHAFFREYDEWGIRKVGWTGASKTMLEHYALLRPSVAVSPDGRICIAATEHGDYYHFDAYSGECSRKFSGQGGSSPRLLFVRDGEICLGVENDGTVRAYYPETGDERILGNLTSHNTTLVDLRDREHFAATGDQRICIYSYLTGAKKGQLRHNFDPARFLAMTKDGCILSIHGGSRDIPRVRVVSWLRSDFSSKDTEQSCTRFSTDKKPEITEKRSLLHRVASLLRTEREPGATEKIPLLRTEVNGVYHASGLFFPSKIGDFSLVDAKALAAGPEDDSTTVRYDYDSGSPLMDIYIYSKGKASLPRGIESQAMGNELGEVSHGIKDFLEASGRASAVETISTDIVNAGKQEFVRRVFLINSRNGPVQATLLYLTTFGQYFVKVRCTCLDFHQEATKRYVEQCLAALSKKSPGNEPRQSEEGERYDRI
jgi:serine/threonine protein kinase/WD40 repeat protein